MAPKRIRVLKKFTGGALDGATEFYDGPPTKPMEVVARYSPPDDQGVVHSAVFYKLKSEAGGVWDYVHVQTQNMEQFRKNSTGLVGD